jgi:hypothetical protein
MAANMLGLSPVAMARKQAPKKELVWEVEKILGVKETRVL